MSDEFVSFGAMHGVVVIAAGLGIGSAILLARRVHGTSAETRFRQLTAASVLLVNLGWFAFKLSPEQWNRDTSLPLHLCDFAWMATAWSLWTGGPKERLRHQLVYYWGLGLSPLSYLTPTLTDGPGLPYFWVYWFSHWQIMAAALCNQFAFGVRQDWAGFRAVVRVSLALFGAVWVFNQAFDTGYFFSGAAAPESVTPIDFLGPYPLRLLWMVLLVIGLFAVMTRWGRGAQPERS